MLRRSICTTATIQLSAAQIDVFDFVLDPANTKRWNDTVEYVSHRPRGMIRIGTDILCRVRFLGRTIQVPYRIVELDEPNGFLGEGSAEIFTFSSRIGFSTPSDEVYTDVTWSIEIAYPAILSFGSSFVTNRLANELEKSLANLRHIFS